jgi:hypothetical protein
MHVPCRAGALDQLEAMALCTHVSGRTRVVFVELNSGPNHPSSGIL